MSVKLNRNLIHGFKYSSEYIYSKNDIVIESTDDDVLMYKSLIDNNLDSDIHDPTKWECTSIASTHLAMFIPMWSDHMLNDPAWLRADTYSWHDSRIYESAYAILEKENSGRTNSNLSTYTYNGTTVTYYQSPNGYKIASQDQEDEIENIHRQIGVTWFYILDTKKKRFKLPRTEHGFVGLRDNLGGILNVATTGSDLKATEMYLYFCVGGVAKNQHIVNVGEVMEIINNFNLTLFDEKVTEIKDNCLVEIVNKTEDGLESLSQATINSYNVVSNQADEIVADIHSRVDDEIANIRLEGEIQIETARKQADRATQQADRAEAVADTIVYGNIGDIKYTTRLGDAPAGGEWCDGSLFEKSRYPDFYQMLIDGKIQHVDITTYNNAVSLNGSCGVFGLDTTNETFKVPTIPALLLTKEQAAVIGNGMTLGLTDGTNFGGLIADNIAVRSGSPFYNDVYGKNIGTSGSTSKTANKSIGVTTDPTQSGIIANLDVIEYKAYVLIYSGVKEFSIADYTNLLETTTNDGIDEVNQTKDNAITEIESLIDDAQEIVSGVHLLVNVTDDQEIDGVKTFKQTPKIASTLNASDNSNNVVTSGWVNDFYDNKRSISNISATSGTVSLQENKIYTMSITDVVTFTLPTPTNKNVFNQIKVMIKVTGAPVIDWGTTYFFNRTTPTVETGNYDIYFDYDNLLDGWVMGIITKGTDN